MSTAADSIPSAESILEWFVGEEITMLALLKRLVALEAPSADVEGIGAFVSAYRTELERWGATATEIPGPNGPHLYAELPASGSERGPPIALVGHADTVWPRGELQRRPMRIDRGRLYGPGVFDMRAGLSLIVFLLRFLHERGVRLDRRLQVFVAADEELGSITAHEHMQLLLSREAIGLVVEPPLPDGSLKAQRKGVGLYTLRVHGREAHAGVEPERGVSAIVELMQSSLEIHSWAKAIEGLTVNLGQVRGGTATNVVPGTASVGIDVRFDRLEDGERFDRRLRELAPRHSEARFELEGGIIFPPLVPDARARRLGELARAAARSIGLEIDAGKTGGGSDASFLASFGMAVLDGLGVDGGGAHALDEHIVIERLPVRGAILTRLVLELATGAGGGDGVDGGGASWRASPRAR